MAILSETLPFLVVFAVVVVDVDLLKASSGSGAPQITAGAN